MFGTFSCKSPKIHSNMWQLIVLLLMNQLIMRALVANIQSLHSAFVNPLS